jgi:hypothetical protein
MKKTQQTILLEISDTKHLINLKENWVLLKTCDKFAFASSPNSSSKRCTIVPKNKENSTFPTFSTFN